MAGDGSITAGELAMSIFKRHDKDGNGNLDRKELAALLEDFSDTLGLTLPKEEEERLINIQFEKSDTNSDGMLSIDEFVKFADHLDSVASSLGGASNPKGDTSATEMPVGYKSKPLSLLTEAGDARMDLFERYDVNKDHLLDVGEAEALLKATLEEWEITNDWVTAGWVTQQFRAVTGEGDSEIRGQTAITADEFQIFCQSIMNFIVHLGPAMERHGSLEGDLAAHSPGKGAFGAGAVMEEPAPEGGEAAAADAVAPKGGCCTIS